MSEPVGSPGGERDNAAMSEPVGPPGGERDNAAMSEPVGSPGDERDNAAVRVICLLETDADGAVDGSLRALEVARQLAASAGADLAAVWFGPQDAVSAAQLLAGGVRLAHAVEHPGLSGYVPLAWARALAALASTPFGAAGTAIAVVAAATDHGSEVLAHLGAITGLPVAANCVAASQPEPGEFRLVRQRWGGSLLEDAVLEAPLALLSVAADAVPVPAAAEAGLDREVIVSGFVPELADGDLLVRATESADRRSGASLATARVVVGGGRGVGGEEGFAPLEELAGLLGGALGVSRVVTSQGWRPHQQQVGQTGTKITPELYLACGISGAIQHMAGCHGAKTIVAINTDPGAPMMTRADYAVVGDLHQVIPALIEAIRARHG